jgi:hypothetical protein
MGGDPIGGSTEYFAGLRNAHGEVGQHRQGQRRQRSTDARVPTRRLRASLVQAMMQ